MKILFVNLSKLRFTVATPDNEPLGGTESSIGYLARNLAKRGHDVALIAHLPAALASNLIMEVRHFEPTVLLNDAFLKAENFDAIIVVSRPVAGLSIKAMAPSSLLLLWNHLAPDQENMQVLKEAEARDAFDGFVYVSDWQRQVTEQWFHFTKPYAVIGNGFAPAFENMFASATELRAAKENRAAYTTTPFRGLDVLVDAMEGLEGGTKLDIYSSMRVYQDSADAHFIDLYNRAAANPHIVQHGAVAQGELAERLRPVSFFTYPSTYAETFCIAGLEALAAGMKLVMTQTSALPETMMGFADFVDVSVGNRPKLVADYRALIERNVAAFQTDPAAWAEERFATLQHVNRTCTWAERAKEWERLLSRLITSPVSGIPA